MFENMCRVLCTKEEIASIFEVNRSTLDRWVMRTYGVNFATIYIKYSNEGKMSLRRTLFQMAQTKPNVAMFLAKNLLGMNESLDITTKPITKIPVEITGAISQDRINAIEASIEVVEQ